MFVGNKAKIQAFMTQTRPKPEHSIQNLIYHFSIISIMKNAVPSLLALLLISAVSFVSCKKDDSLQDRLVGNWHSSQVKSGGTDYSAIVEFNLDLQSSQEFDLDVITTLPFTGSSTQSYNGDWKEDEAKQDLILTFNNTSSTYEIVELSGNVMKAETVYEGTRYEVTFER